MRMLNVYGLPELLQPESIRGEIAVVIDVLRATTTTVCALAAGAQAVVPVLEVEEAKKLKAKILAGADPRFPDPVAESDLLLGGERGGKRIEGFDFGNSPREYTPEKVGGKLILFSTTNGTRAMHRTRFAGAIFPAGFVNAQAVVNRLLEHERVHILCAGTDGKMTEEDLLLAGCLVERLQRLSPNRWEMNAQALSVLGQWESLFPPKKTLHAKPISPDALAGQLRQSAGGKNLLNIGLGSDILLAAQIDSLDRLARLDPNTMIVR